ncbi:MAG: DeoR/GlpR family DNA-binding transcription regulator [Acidobacteriota bacterium]|nr:DeoR/GlpR family DNA-binding transcription regulator [Acidobacteriota bacterium]
MLVQQRHSYIARAIQSGAQVQTIELARALHVSQETIRRDLMRLEEQGVLRRVYGGAIAPTRQRSSEPPLAQRSGINAAAKLAIGDIATRLVKPGQMIFVDVGTTAQAVARALAPVFKGTIVSHSLLVALEAAQDRQADLILAPGRLRLGEWSLSGSATHKFIQTMYFDVAFLSCGGVDASAGPTDFDLDDVEIKRTVARNSKQSFVLADSSKHGVVGRYSLGDWYDFGGLIADALPPDGLTRAITVVGGAIHLPEQLAPE